MMRRGSSCAVTEGTDRPTKYSSSRLRHRRQRRSRRERYNTEKQSNGGKTEKPRKIFSVRLRSSVSLCYTVPSVPSVHLEHELQTELQLPHRFSRARDRAVLRTGQRGVRVVPDRIVQDV